MKFIASVIFLFFVLLFYPKSEKREDFFVQVTIAVFTIMELHTVWAYITLDVFDIGFELSYYATYNCCMALLIIFCWIIGKKGQIQKFSAETHMWITMGLLFAVVMAVGIWRYGSKFNQFAYCSADSAGHLAGVEYIFSFGKLPYLRGRYFLHVNEALLLKCFGRYIQPMSYYRVFLLAELFFLYLSGAMFYALIKKYMRTKYNICMGVIFVLLYTFGYPMNNLLYGYEYLGASVTIAIHVEYLLEKMFSQKKVQLDTMVMLLGALFAMYHCYSLLFMAVLLGLGIAYCIYIFRNRSVFKICSIIFLCVFAGCKFETIYVFFQQMLSQLGNEAIMYRDLWSNLLWFFPLLLIGLKDTIDKEGNFVPFAMFIGTVATVVMFLVYVRRGEVSSYYFYKFYYLLWLFYMYISYIGTTAICCNAIKVSQVYLILIILNFVMSDAFAEKLNFDIYYFNWKILSMKESNMDSKRQELFYVAAEKVMETGGVVPYIGEWEEYWSEYYYALTNQVKSEIQGMQAFYMTNYYANYGDSLDFQLQTYIYDKYDYVPYIMVERNSDAYWYGIGYYSTLEVVYENEYGFIYKR